MKTIVIYFWLIASILQAQTPQVIRGPYLQSPGPNSIVIRWRTDIATDSRVYYSQAFGVTTNFKDSSAVTTEHRVHLKDLQPNTKYYYMVGNSTLTLRGPDSLLHFTTAPDPNSPKPVRLWVIGDFGRGNEGQTIVRNAFLNYADTTRPANLWLWTGDNVYYDGTDVEYQTKLFEGINGYQDVFPNLPFASTSGNHDYSSVCPVQPIFCNSDPNTHSGPYLDLIDPPTNGELGGVPSNRKLYYSFDYGDIHFISLNSELGSANPNYNWLGVLNNDTAFTSPMIEWLKADIAATDKKWKIALWHTPPYSFHPSLTEFQPFCVATRVHFNTILEKHGIDLVLNGHDHTYQRSYLINGHYELRDSFKVSMMIDSSSGNDDLGEAYVKYTDGPMAGIGTVYTIVGNSGIGDSYIPKDDPAIYYGHICDTCIGSLIIDIDGNRLDAKYLTGESEILDQFTIIKRTVSGINDFHRVENNLKVYPNPFNEMAHLTFYASDPGDYTLEFVDLLGKLQFSQDIKVTVTGKQELEFNVSQHNIPNGSYTIKVTHEQKNEFIRVVKMD